MRRLRTTTAAAAVTLAIGACSWTGQGIARADNPVHYECQNGIRLILPPTATPLVIGNPCTGPVGTFPESIIHVINGPTYTCPTTTAGMANNAVFVSSRNC